MKKEIKINQIWKARAGAAFAIWVVNHRRFSHWYCKLFYCSIPKTEKRLNLVPEETTLGSKFGSWTYLGEICPRCSNICDQKCFLKL